jgi:membrane protein DedA with SNARE-associated domain
MTDIWSQLIDFLSANEADPATYLLIFFIFCVAAVNPSIFFPIKALVMGLGKAVGATGVFFIGRKIDETVGVYARKWRWYRWLLVKSENLVRRYGYPAMFVIMSIPGMVDTIPLYVFSVLNKEGELMTLKGFVLVNFLAGITRAILIFTLFTAFGVELF